VIVIASMMVMIVMAVARVITLGGRVGAAFRIERGFDRRDPGAEIDQEHFDRWTAPHAQPIRKDLDRHVTVAEIPREAREAVEVLGARLQQRFGFGHHLHQAAVAEDQRIAHAQRNGRGEVELDGRPLHADKPATLHAPTFESEDDGIDDLFVIDDCASKNTGDARHERDAIATGIS
jgi:hypothetical protein